MVAAIPISKIDPKPPDKSFADIVAGKHINKSFANNNPSSPKALIQVKPSSTYKGEPAVIFSRDDIQKLAEPFVFTLIGKFSSGRPPVEAIRKVFGALNLQADFHIGLLDAKHVLIRLQTEADYTRIWMKEQWYIFNYPMKVLKWTTNFVPNVECPITPVWILFPALPPHFFHKPALESIAQLVGKPLQLDMSTVTLARPSVARACVELDVTKPILKRVWIGCEDGSGHWQPVEYENAPKYCSVCSMFGHTDRECGTKDQGKLMTHKSMPSEKQDNNNQRWTPVKNKEGRSENNTQNKEAPNETPREDQGKVLITLTQNMPTKSVDPIRDQTIDNNTVDVSKESQEDDQTQENEVLDCSKSQVFEDPGNTNSATHNELGDASSMESQEDDQTQDIVLDCSKAQDFEEQDEGFSDDEYDAFLLHRIEDPLCTPKAWKMMQNEDFKLVVSKKTKKKEKSIEKSVTNSKVTERPKSADRERPRRTPKRPARYY